MKKLLLAAVVAVSLVACGETANNNEEDTMTDTSTIVTQDTAQVVTDTTITTDTINADK